MSPLSSILLTAACALFLPFPAAANPVSLQPLSTAGAATGTGLAGNWFKVDDDSRFSTLPYTDASGQSGPIASFAWGSGFWSMQDVHNAADGRFGNVLARASSVSAVSFANPLYNQLAADGSYGSWSMDHVRALAPILDAPGCPQPAACTQNHAALFSGYLYIAQAGSFGLGVFADDAFALTLRGTDGTLSLTHDSVVGSSGRDFLSLDGLLLDAGYYALELGYFNRLDAGVLDLLWKPEGSDWRSIDSTALFADLPQQVPEPGTMPLSVLALLVVGLMMLRRMQRPCP